MDRFTVTNITSAKRLVNRRKNDTLITAHNTHRFSNSFSTNRFTRIQRHFIKLFRTLKNDKSVTIYHRNFQTLVYEAFKIKNNMAPKILTFFPTRNTIIMSKIAQGCRVELLKLPLMAQKLYLVWDQKYETFYQASYIIKKKNREWVSNNCSCRLRKTYLQNIRFL